MTETNITKIENYEDYYLLHFLRKNIFFQAGQHIQLSLPSLGIWREYSLVSSEKDHELCILFRKIPSGILTPLLSESKPGIPLWIYGPLGNFIWNEDVENPLFIATGTGVAPFLSMVRSYPKRQYELWLGLKSINSFFHDLLPSNTKVFFSEESLVNSQYKNYSKRIDTHLKSQNNFFWDSIRKRKIYICGNIEVINNLFLLFIENGVSDSQIMTEQYY